MAPVYCWHAVSIIWQVVHFRQLEFLFFSEGSAKLINFFFPFLFWVRPRGFGKPRSTNPRKVRDNCFVLPGTFEPWISTLWQSNQEQNTSVWTFSIIFQTITRTNYFLQTTEPTSTLIYSFVSKGVTCTSHPLRQMIKFYVFHGCKHDGIPKCA